jgi:hypothetical protein
MKGIRLSPRFFAALTFTDPTKTYPKKQNLEISEPLFYSQIIKLELQSNMTFGGKNAEEFL